MNRESEPSIGSFEGAALFQLRVALKSTYAERLQDLQDMLDFYSLASRARQQPRYRGALAGTKILP